MLPLESIYRNRLPHLTPASGIFFITFRLNDSLPQTLVRTLSQQLEDAIHRIEKEENVDRELRVKEER